LVTPHSLYKLLGKYVQERQKNYRQLFRSKITEKSMTEIRGATNKSWVLGNEQFKIKIEQLTSRQVKPKPRGGDRRSEKFHSDESNRV